MRFFLLSDSVDFAMRNWQQKSEPEGRVTFRPGSNRWSHTGGGLINGWLKEYHSPALFADPRLEIPANFLAGGPRPWRRIRHSGRPTSGRRKMVERQVTPTKTMFLQLGRKRCQIATFEQASSSATAGRESRRAYWLKKKSPAEAGLPSDDLSPI
jgi:hypothetical protein